MGRTRDQNQSIPGDGNLQTHRSFDTRCVRTCFGRLTDEHPWQEAPIYGARRNRKMGDPLGGFGHPDEVTAQGAMERYRRVPEPNPQPTFPLLGEFGVRTTSPNRIHEKTSRGPNQLCLPAMASTSQANHSGASRFLPNPIPYGAPSITQSATYQRIGCGHNSVLQNRRPGHLETL